MRLESRPAFHSAMRGSASFIQLALWALPNLAVLALTFIAVDGPSRLAVAVPAVIIAGLLLLELWAIATLRLEVDEHGLRWRSAQRRVQLA